MSTVPVKNSLTRDTQGVPYEFTLDHEQRLQVNGLTASTWLYMAKTEIRLAGMPRDHAAQMYIDKALACIENQIDPRKWEGK